MQSGKKIWLVAVMAILVLGTSSSAVALVAPDWFVNGVPVGGVPASVASQAGSKVVFRVPEQFEVICEKLAEISGSGFRASYLSGEPFNAFIHMPTVAAKECKTVKNLKKTEAEKCEVESSEVLFNQLESKVVWKESTGEEQMIYVFGASNGGPVENTNALWATISIKDKGSESCPAPLEGDHPLRGQMLAKLDTPTSEQTKKVFESTEASKCSQVKTYYEGEPRKADSSEGLTIGGEKGAELCSVLEIGLVSGGKFSMQ